MRLGDWFRVGQLVREGGGSSEDEVLNLAINKMGDYYADRQKWAKAAERYQQSKNIAALVPCYYMLERWSEMEGLIQELPSVSY